MRPLLGARSMGKIRMVGFRSRRSRWPKPSVLTLLVRRMRSFRTEVKGSIAAGKLADLVMLSRDIYQIDPKEIEKVKVVLTIVDGQIVHSRSQ